MVFDRFRRSGQEPPESLQPAPALPLVTSGREFDEDEDEVTEAPAPLVPAVVPVAEPERPATAAESPQQQELNELLEVPQDTDNDMDIRDLVEVDMEADVYGGDLGDVIEVSTADIMGDEDGMREGEPPRPAQQRRRQRPLRRQFPAPPITSLRGIRR